MSDHVKIGVGVAGVDRLRHEAEVLRTFRHPGVVELVAFEDNGGVAELRTVGVDGPTLASVQGPSPADVAAVGAAVATTLADLHEAGLVHGAVDASHVILGENGPVLTGFADAGPPRGGRQAGDDVGALATAVLSIVSDGPVADAARRMVDGSATAREAAAAFAGCASAPSPSHEGPDTLTALLRPATRPARRRMRRRWLVGPAVGLAMVSAIVVATSDRRSTPTVALSAPRSTMTSAPIPTSTSTAPTATLVWPPARPVTTIEFDDHRYAIGAPGDVAIPLRCTGHAAALLRPETGQVFVFGEAATPDHDTRGTPVATVAGGTGLATGDSCDAVLVERDGLPPVPVHLDGRP
jgi:tRNA A-37 threonylcarbamoyl transferase component Bud32